MSEKPNIVMIMADQMTMKVIGAHGHPVVNTPNLDNLVQSGATFNNCYCNSPLCVPSRASMVTSKLPSNIEVYDNGSELRSSVPTFVHRLRRGGYKTILAGKMHFIGPDQLHGFEERISKDIHTAGFDLTPDWSRGAYHNHGTGVKRLRQAGLCDWNNQLRNDEHTLYSVLDKIRMIGKEQNQSPFFLCASFTHPHDPFVITKEYWDLYKDIDVPMPTVQGKPLDELHPYNQWIQTHHEIDDCELTDEQIRDNRRAYYAMVHYIDDKVGEILHELERMKLKDNTIIIFTSDHGEMLGEHGMWFKRTFYDAAAKVPLIVSAPNWIAKGQRIDEVVSLVDLGPSILEFAGLSAPELQGYETDGESFVPLVQGQGEGWKDEAICEYFGEGPLHPLVAYRKGRYKYVHVHGCDPLLFDLESDPNEETNQIDHPDFVSIRSDFAAWMDKHYDFAELEGKVLRSQQERLMMTEALHTGERTAWEHRRGQL